MRGLTADVQLALRSLARQPTSTAAIVLTLALGIGATTATYAIFNYVLFRPVPGVGDTRRLVTVAFEKPDNPRSISSGARRALADMRGAPALDRVGDGSTTDVPVVAGNDAEPAMTRVELVSDQYFEILGVRARIGRVFTDAEAASDARVVLLSEPMWKRAYGGSPAVIGQRLAVSGHPFTIIGVVAAYQGWSPTRIGNVDIWVPVGAATAATLREDGDYLGSVVARLRPGATLLQAQDQLRSIYKHVIPAATFLPSFHPGLYSAQGAALFKRIYAVFPFAMGGTALLLLLACANTANLLLARLARRATDIALRSAIGAGRWRLFRGLLVETLAMSACAGALGLALAFRLTRALSGAHLFRVGPSLGDVPIDWRVVAFALATSAATILLFGLLPSIMAARVDLSRLLNQSHRSTSGPRRLRSVLVCVQLALSLALVATAGVFTRSLTYLTTLDLGMKPDDVVTVTVNTRVVGYDAVRHAAFVKAALRRLSEMPGVETAGAASPSALTQNQFPRNVRADAGGSDEFTTALHNAVSGGYFGALGVPIVSGRTFTDGEFLATPGGTVGVAVINEALARQLFGGGPAVGRMIAVAKSAAGTVEIARRDVVVGVAGDAKTGSRFLTDHRPAFYEPGNAVLVLDTFYIRAHVAPEEAMANARRALHEVEPGLPLMDLQTLRGEVAALFPDDIALARLMRLVAALATLLGVAGVYGVMTYTLGERRREFGIRMALGASASDVARLVLKGVVMLALIGSAAGIAIFVACSHFLAARLSGVQALDPLTLVAASALIAFTAVFAAWIPAHRATRINPTIALRSE